MGEKTHYDCRTPSDPNVQESEVRATMLTDGEHEWQPRCIRRSLTLISATILCR